MVQEYKVALLLALIIIVIDFSKKTQISYSFEGASFVKLLQLLQHITTRSNISTRYTKYTKFILRSNPTLFVACFWKKKSTGPRA